MKERNLGRKLVSIYRTHYSALNFSNEWVGNLLCETSVLFLLVSSLITYTNHYLDIDRHAENPDQNMA